MSQHNFNSRNYYYIPRQRKGTSEGCPQWTSRISCGYLNFISGYISNILRKNKWKLNIQIARRPQDHPEYVQNILGYFMLPGSWHKSNSEFLLYLDVTPTVRNILNNILQYLCSIPNILLKFHYENLILRIIK